MNQNNRTIKIRYFASLREKAMKSEEVIETNAETAAMLYQELSLKYGFTLTLHYLRVSINNNFSDLNSQLKSNDELVFIPPVAGG